MKRTLPLFLLACGGLASPDRWTVEWHDNVAPLANTDLAIQVAQEHAPCTTDAIRGGTIRFYQDPFPCGDLTQAAGCAWQDGSGSYSILWRDQIEATALWDELGHNVWLACFSRTGENDLHVYDADFVAWLDGVRADFTRRRP